MTLSNSIPLPHDLIDRIRSGDAQAFELVFSTFYTVLAEFAERYTRDSALAEDVVDDVFTNLWQMRLQWNPRMGIRSYLFGAVRNRALNAIRQNRNNLPLPLSGSLRDIHTSANSHIYSNIEGAEEENAEQSLLRNESWQQLSDAIEHLSDREKLLIRLRWREQLSWEEIASILEISIAAAQMQHTRTLRVLRDRLRNHFL